MSVEQQHSVDKTKLYKKSFFITINCNIRSDPDDPALDSHVQKYKDVFTDLISHDTLRELIRFTPKYSHATYDTHVKQIISPSAVVEIGGKESRVHVHILLPVSAWANIAGGPSIRHYRSVLIQLVQRHFGLEMNPHLDIKITGDVNETIEDYMMKHMRRG